MAATRTAALAFVVLVVAGCAAARDARSPIPVAGSATASSPGATASPTKKSPSPAPSTLATPTAATTPVPSSSLAGAPGWIAYQACATCGSDLDDGIYLVRPDGSTTTPILASLTGRKAHPDFSRDGKRLAFDNLQSEDGTDQTYIADADGSNPKLVGACPLPDCLQVWEPAWSPDGRKLAVSLAGGPLGPDGPASFGIGIIDVSSGKLTSLFSNGLADGQDHFPRWSPDGSRLLFWRERIDANGAHTAIFSIAAKPGQPTQLTDWDLDAGDPDWSPDGSTIVYSTRPLLTFDSGPSQLFLMEPDGSNARQLTQDPAVGPRATQPRWSPDGRSVLYTRDTGGGMTRRTWAIDVDGTANAQLVDAFSTHGTLQPTP